METMKNISNSRRIAEYYPNAEEVAYTDKKAGFVFYKESELKDVSGDWFPLSCHKDTKTNEIIYGGLPGITHTYIEGETGVGKTTRFVMQTIRALASTKSKPSFYIIDLHHEIIENLHGFFKENGYDIKIINCQKPERGIAYNPFYLSAKSVQETGEIDGDTEDYIRTVSEAISPIQSKTDDIWDSGAQSFTVGGIYNLFECLLDGYIEPENVTFGNLILNHDWLLDKLDLSRVMTRLDSIPFYSKKDKKSVSYRKMSPIISEPDKTRSCFLNQVSHRYDKISNINFLKFTSENDLDIEAVTEKPTVVVIQPGGSEASTFICALMLIEMLSVIKRKSIDKIGFKKLDREIHCFLDEFANFNFGENSRFLEMLTTTRKFGMHWHMFVQCDSQITNKYGECNATTIRANCTEIFMGSNDYTTLRRFSEACGERTIENINSNIYSDKTEYTIVKLITPEKLSLLEEGYMYIRKRKYPLIKTYIEAYYNCFENTSTKEDIYPYKTYDIHKYDFTPDSFGNGVDEKVAEVIKQLNMKRFEKVEKYYEEKEQDGYFRAVMGLFDDLDYIEDSSLGVSSDDIKTLKALVGHKYNVSKDKYYKDNTSDSGFVALKKHYEENRENINLKDIYSHSLIPRDLFFILQGLYNESPSIYYGFKYPSDAELDRFVKETFATAHDSDIRHLMDTEIIDTLDIKLKEIKDSNLFPKAIMYSFERICDDIKQMIFTASANKFRLTYSRCKVFPFGVFDDD